MHCVYFITITWDNALSLILGYCLISWGAYLECNLISEFLSNTCYSNSEPADFDTCRWICGGFHCAFWLTISGYPSPHSWYSGTWWLCLGSLVSKSTALFVSIGFPPMMQYMLCMTQPLKWIFSASI